MSASAVLQRQLVEAKFPISKSFLGSLTEKQFRILSLRSRGFSQSEIAGELKLSRASVSMIERRARKKIEQAKQTIKIYNLVQTQHDVTIEVGTRLLEVPMVVLKEADRAGIHLKSNMVEILRIVKSRASDSLSQDGRTIKKISFSFNERGKLLLHTEDKRELLPPDC
jgi:HTH-type transcriptional regulator, fmd operon transcriptional regulator